MAGPPAGRFQLRALTRRIAELTQLRVAEKNRLFAAQASRALGREVARSSERLLKQLQQESERLSRLALKLVLADAELAQAYDYLVGIKGIAQLSALKLLGELGVLPRELGPRQWTAFAGLDPRPCESGTLARPRHISRQGQSYLRRALYMPALVAVRFEPAFKACYERLLQRGKPKLLALTAVMRKLLTAIWAMLHHHQPFDGQKLFHPAA